MKKVLMMIGGLALAGVGAGYLMTRGPSPEPGSAGAAPGERGDDRESIRHGRPDPGRQHEQMELRRVIRAGAEREGSQPTVEGATGASGLPVGAAGGQIQPLVAPGAAQEEAAGQPGGANGKGTGAPVMKPGIGGWIKSRNQAPNTPEARQARLQLLRARVAKIPQEISAARDLLKRRGAVGEVPMDEEENVRKSIENMEAALDRAKKDLAKLESEGVGKPGKSAPAP